jgi:spore coat protein U-like protein
MLNVSKQRLLLAVATATLATVLSVSETNAATTTATFTVSATVVATCNVTTTNLNFGSYSGVALAGTSTVSATCSSGTPYTVGLNPGTSTGATVTTRKMTGPGAQVLSYGLFQDSGHATNWGNTAGTDTQAGTGNGAAQSFTVFGQIPAGQFPQAGSYSDTITATVAF